MLATLILLTAGGLFLWLTFGRWFQSTSWAATVTPLASIMGSGFLISAPLLAGVVGNASPVVMAALLAVAWLIGSAIRFNIRYAEPIVESSDTSEPSENSVDEHAAHRGHAATSRLPLSGLETTSHLILAAAYFISVTYYVQLLCNFTLHSLGRDEPPMIRLMGTCILAGISITGFMFGLKIIEKVERYAINLNLAMIGSLLVGLAAHNLGLWQAGQWRLPELTQPLSVWDAVRISMGLLVVVQGFETSRFLGSEHSAQQRIVTMRWAQVIASVIYLTFLTLMLVVITPDQAGLDTNVTAIVTLAGTVSAVLPLMLTLAAAGSQFSAAVADEAGCGGLLSHLAGHWLSSRTSYLAIGAITIAIVWSVDVKQIISLASRAFALFYCLQCMVAALISARQKGGKWKTAGFSLLAMVCLGVTLLGKSAE